MVALLLSHADVTLWLCASHLACRDISSLSRVCRSSRALLASDSAARAVAHLRYSPRFWTLAAARPPSAVHLPTWAQELDRLEKHEAFLQELGLPPWSEEDYFALWRAIDGGHEV